MYQFFEEKQSAGFSLIDGFDIQKLQDCFCKLSNIFVFAVNAKGKRITEISGREKEAELLIDVVGEAAFDELAMRAMESPLEDQLVEDTEYANIKIAAVAVKTGGRPIMCWLACCVLSDMEVVTPGKMFRGCSTCVGRKHFYRGLDLLGIVANQVVSMANHIKSAEDENIRSKNSVSELGRDLKKTEAITNVLQFLVSDKSFEDIAAQILEIVGKYLGVTGTQLMQVSRDGQSVEAAAEWVEAGRAPMYEHLQCVKRTEIFRNEKPLVISKDTMISPEIRSFMQKYEMKAMMVLPLIVNDKVGMYFCITDFTKERTWQIDEVRFVSDVIKVLQSMLIRRIQKNSLTSSYVSLQAILDNIGACIYVRDSETREILFMNSMLKETFREEIAKHHFDELIDKARPTGVKEGYYEVHNIENKKWYDLYYTYISWVDGRKVSLCSLYDVTDKKLYQKRIEQQAYTDFLTGLYNRMCCERDLACQIDKAKINGTIGGLLYLDLDDFKHINDGLGHQYGDVLLKSISQSLKQIDGIMNTCYRMGGDEFVIIVPPESFLNFETIIDEIKNVFAKPWYLKDADYYCTMSMGICTFPDQGEDVQDIIKKADIAMYEAKKTGKNRISRYSDTIESASNKRLDLEKNMRNASQNNCNEFEVYYQPIIDIQNKGTTCVGAEALLRWNSSVLGFIPPSEFIPLAEYLGLINPIGNHVLKEACRACKYWNENGHPQYKVNVNLSVVQLLQNDIVEIVTDIIKETGINPDRLTLEVTESLAINDMKRMKDILSKIRGLGARVALDDFGTGYSSLNHIREIPLDVIKVDQSFVADLAEDEYSRSFINMVSELANAIGVNICVEGVETETQYKILEGMKVCMVQGYYFDRPMSRAEFERKYI